ncbi:23S rRNA pseudouridine(955/2504/2580) synthase [Candidatus Endobugula sertula]|uniref:Pseudouridine synthase n=1 Tax=Candidatus Endobugula sertula TaxID=62101 RepID=A0A1D2QPA2_9GAMM|nr:23S rRNA pseudouridine(955/2504/2580) synthase [Candidatus Endobugula sertula]
MNSSCSPISVQFVEVDDANVGQRIDNFLVSYLKGVPKSRIYRILRKGEVRVNKGRVKPEYKLCDGDTVRIPPIRVSERTPALQPNANLSQLLETSVLFENDELLVVNKPSGLAVHGGSGISLGLIESFRQIRPDSRFLELAHRLDRDTSGCIMIAKKRSSLRHIHQQLRGGHIQKVYQALVAGRWPNRRKIVNASLVKNQLASGERIVRVAGVDTKGAKCSLTEYRIIQRYQGCTLVEAKPITGRTHQIRVHCQSVGCSVIGDDKYCDTDINKHYRQLGLKRLFLHAYRLEFTLSDGQPLVVTAPLSGELALVLDRLLVEPGV